jgi:hypothetical protein
MFSIYPKWWKKHFLRVEFLIGVLASAAFAVWTYKGGKDVLLQLEHSNRGAIYSALASLFGSLLGFAITAMSIVMGFISSDRLTIIRRSAHYKDLWAVFTSAIRFLGVTTIASLVGLIFDREGVQRPYLFVICISLSFLCALRVARCLWVLERIVSVLTMPSPNEQ